MFLLDFQWQIFDANSELGPQLREGTLNITTVVPQTSKMDTKSAFKPSITAA